MGSVDNKDWAEYDGLQHGKHQLLKKYLGGRFPVPYAKRANRRHRDGT
jgi:hypothetical protein